MPREIGWLWSASYLCAECYVVTQIFLFTIIIDLYGAASNYDASPKSLLAASVCWIHGMTSLCLILQVQSSIYSCIKHR